MTLSNGVRARLTAALHGLETDRNDHQGWGLLYGALWPRVYAQAYHGLRGIKPAAEDVAQAAFLKLYLDPTFPGRVESADHLANLMQSIVRNECVNLWRRDSRQPTISLEDALLSGQIESDESANPDRRLELGELSSALKNEVAQWATEDQRLIELLLTDQPRAAIALQLGQSYSAVGVRLHRLRRKLRKALEDKQLHPAT